MFAFSHSRAEGGENAGRNSWGAAVNASSNKKFRLLDTPDKIEAFKDWAGEFGAWDDEERAAWSDAESNALLLQFIAGDVRESPAILDGVDFEEREEKWFYQTRRAESLEEIDWPEQEAQSQAGRISGRIFRSDDGQIYFSISN